MYFQMQVMNLKLKNKSTDPIQFVYLQSVLVKSCIYIFSQYFKKLMLIALHAHPELTFREHA